MIHLLVAAFGEALPIGFAWPIRFAWFDSSVFVWYVMWCMSLLYWGGWSGRGVVVGVVDA